MSRKRAPAPPKLDLKGAWVTWGTLGYGTTMFLCYVTYMPAPVGMVWGYGAGSGNGAKSRFEVWGSYVPVPCRRSGVRSLINDEILKHYEVITSQGGTPEGGEAFMLAAGYRKDRRTSFWSKVRP